MTPPGIETATYRFVAQYLNHCATAVPTWPIPFAVLWDVTLCRGANRSRRFGTSYRSLVRSRSTRRMDFLTFAVLCVYLLHYVCIAVFTLDAGLLARSQYTEGPATGHIDTGFSSFRCVYKQILRWFPRFQVATTCFSCSPPDLNLLVTNFIFCIHVK